MYITTSIRNYQQKWTEEHFKVSQLYTRDGIPVYKPTDLSQYSTECTFYESEVLKVINTNNTLQGQEDTGGKDVEVKLRKST